MLPGAAGPGERRSPRVGAGMRGAPLEVRFWALVDKDGPGGCWLWTGSILDTGYGQISVGPRGSARRWLAHRLSWELVNGPIPAGMKIDHRCHVPQCVNPAPEHLRLATTKQNAENRIGPQKGNRSGYRGVCWNRGRGAWEAACQHNGRKVFGGYFADIEEAAKAAAELRRGLFTHSDMDRSAERVA